MTVKRPECGGRLQATQKIDWTMNFDGEFYETSDGVFDWNFYCENDHLFGGSYGSVQTAASELRTIRDRDMA